jgi:hypothetical protein
MSVRAGELMPLEDATADWYETEYLPAIAAVHEAELPQAYEHTTKGDIYVWVQAKRRELRTTNRNSTWADAVLAARREGVSRREQRPLKRERRRPLPRPGQTYWVHSSARSTPQALHTSRARSTRAGGGTAPNGAGEQLTESSRGPMPEARQSLRDDIEVVPSNSAVV